MSRDSCLEGVRARREQEQGRRIVDVLLKRAEGTRFIDSHGVEQRTEGLIAEKKRRRTKVWGEGSRSGFRQGLSIHGEKNKAARYERGPLGFGEKSGTCHTEDRMVFLTNSCEIHRSHKSFEKMVGSQNKCTILDWSDIR